jgi:hypothetical protein
MHIHGKMLNLVEYQCALAMLLFRMFSAKVDTMLTHVTTKQAIASLNEQKVYWATKDSLLGSH